MLGKTRFALLGATLFALSHPVLAADATTDQTEINEPRDADTSPTRTETEAAPVPAAPNTSGADTVPTSVLSDVQVEGSGIEQTLPAELSAYGAERQVIDRQQLDDTGMTDVAQALERLAPGLFLAPRGGRGSYFNASLDGSRTQDILWLVDGVRINNRLYGGTTPLDSITTEMIDYIEVLRGGQGLFYGTQAVAGVINIVLRDPSPNNAGQLRLGTGTFHDRRAAGHYSGPSPAGRWLVFGAYDESEGFDPYPRSAYHGNGRPRDTGFKRRSVGGKYHAAPAKDNALDLLLIYNNVVVDQPRTINNFKAFNDRDEVIASAKWDQRLSSHFGYYGKAYWHSWWSDWTQIGRNDDGSRHVVDDAQSWGYNDYGLNLTGRYNVHNGSQLLFGYDLQAYSGHDYVVQIADRSETVHAGFIQFRPVLPFSASTDLAIGARYNYSEFGGAHTIWNASMAQPVGRDVQVKASVGTNFLLPTAYQLFAVDPRYAEGNPGLKPERSLNTRLALIGNIGANVQWTLGGFYRRIDDLITPIDGRFTNGESGARVRGGQAILTIGGETGWHVDGSATYADSESLDGGGQVDGIPVWIAKTSVAWDALDERHGGRLSARYAGDETQRLANFGQQSVGDYTIVDASAYQRFGDHGQHRVTLRVENLTDRRYATDVAQDVDADGRAYRYDTLGVPRNAQLSYTYSF
ncbi:TonB-dependent siderophore receptor [Salinisphaera sp. Q1T1-3]|uniref:TonB-dependent receptor plug domain-containing protein n=1 Tax=Salinisphaera sp. Q1T1-3 TaxID=2321229 RepID=UPI001314D2C8|nr:TonB-dependent receptor [Salinisphaera sp. Q1T1-3]